MDEYYDNCALLIVVIYNNIRTQYHLYLMIMTFCVFSQRAGVRIPFQTTFHSTSVWFFDEVRSGMLETITRIGVCLVASIH